MNVFAAFAVPGSVAVHLAVFAAIALLSPRGVPAPPHSQDMDITLVSLPPPILSETTHPNTAAEPAHLPAGEVPAAHPRPRSRRPPPQKSVPAEATSSRPPEPTAAPHDGESNPSGAGLARSPETTVAAASAAPVAPGARPQNPAGGRTGSRPRAAAGPYSEGDVDARPRLVTDIRPQYPDRALRLGIEGNVAVSLVVDASGSVAEARVLRAAGHGFDEAALRTARQLRFTPGRKRGATVPVRLTWTCRFRLEE